MDYWKLVVLRNGGTKIFSDSYSMLLLVSLVVSIRIQHCEWKSEISI